MARSSAGSIWRGGSANGSSTRAMHRPHPSLAQQKRHRTGFLPGPGSLGAARAHAGCWARGCRIPCRTAYAVGSLTHGPGPFCSPSRHSPPIYLHSHCHCHSLLIHTPFSLVGEESIAPWNDLTPPLPPLLLHSPRSFYVFVRGLILTFFVWFHSGGHI
jgi:hypothetical protein